MSADGPDWARLFRIACALIRQVNSKQTIIDSWSFGGGTAMMLQIDHRESHDAGDKSQENSRCSNGEVLKKLPIQAT